MSMSLWVFCSLSACSIERNQFLTIEVYSTCLQSNDKTALNPQSPSNKLNKIQSSNIEFNPLDIHLFNEITQIMLEVLKQNSGPFSIIQN